ncbi:MAG: tetraacyldisaccharide 4'-kinase [Pseudomonadota bacterium]
MLKAPKFWYQPPSLLSAMCAPIAAGYNLAQRMRQKATTAYKAKIPVICVGNLTVGGAGKTPTVMALVRLLQQQKLEDIHILTRGYGGSLKGPILVDSKQHTFCDVGDEALLLAQVAPTWVGGNRVASAKAAEQVGAQMIIMDDGGQNPTLHKDCCFMVVDGQKGLGNGRILPAGPLREKLPHGLSRTDAVVLIGKDQHNLSKTLSKTMGKSFVNAHIVPLAESTQSIKGKQLLAFAGIGLPDKFFSALEQYAGEILEKVAFPDHYPYRVRDLQPLVQRTKTQDIQLVTTEKDFMRIPASLQPLVTPFRIRLEFENQDAVICRLKQLLAT